MIAATHSKEPPQLFESFRTRKIRDCMSLVRMGTNRPNIDNVPQICSLLHYEVFLKEIHCQSSAHNLESVFPQEPASADRSSL